MTYRLEADEPLAPGLRRALVEELDAAASRLHVVGPGQLDESVHEARKSLKRARTVQRLLRDVIGRDRYRLANERLRDAGRALSGTRDAAVLLATLDELLAGPELAAPAFAGLREALECERAQAERVALGDAGPRKEALELIVAGRADATDWALAGDERQRVLRGVRRVYSRGRRRMRDAVSAPTDTALHEWRKRVKDLGYTFQLVMPAWPQVLEPLAQETRRLWDLLGDDQDLHLLVQAIAERSDSLASPGDHQTLRDLIAARRSALQDGAFDLGTRVYAEAPRAFAKRLGRYLSGR
jgi:CHAD domain-containing protein